MVFAFHYAGGAASGQLLHNVSIMRLQGWRALDLFFALSGFLITGVLYDTRNDSHFFKRFYARRALRIFPVYYLLALVLLALTAVFHYAWRPQHLLFLVYIGNFCGGVYAVALPGACAVPCGKSLYRAPVDAVC